MYICDVHANIECNISNTQYKIDEIEKSLYRLFDSVEDNSIKCELDSIINDLSDISFITKESISDISIAKTMGKDMEDRLIAYCNAIEELGFKRVK